MMVTGLSGQDPLVSGHTDALANQGWPGARPLNNWIAEARESAQNTPWVCPIHITG
jgi:hypothetical protein